MDSLRISLLQTDIIWENKTENLRRIHEKLQSLCGKTDILVLPEMFSTGFSMSPAALAEPVTGETITTLQQWSKQYQMAITGSFIASDSAPASVQHYYNRGFFLTPEGESHFYDKRHLFRIGMEGEQYTAGNQRPIITYKGWHILLLICYDLRFPVWSRNIDNEYDLLIYVASWPSSRRSVWDILLQARAQENLCYTCGVNRIGTDGNGLIYNGGSILYSPKGEALASVPNEKESIATATLSFNQLQNFRKKFPVWQDADRFSIFSDNNSR